MVKLGFFKANSISDGWGYKSRKPVTRLGRIPTRIIHIRYHSEAREEHLAKTSLAYWWLLPLLFPYTFCYPLSMQSQLYVKPCFLREIDLDCWIRNVAKKKIRALRIIQRIYSDFETVFYKFFFFQKGNWISLDEKEHFIALVSAMNFVVIFERRLYFTRCTLNFEDYHQSCQNNLWKEWMEVVSELIIGPFASI